MMFPNKPKNIRKVYLDHAATTAVDPRVVEAMLPYFSTHFGNPSALYSLGRENKQVLDQARKSISEIFGSQPDTIIFTSGGTESDNMAIFGVARHKNIQAVKHESSNFGGHIITTNIEHHAVLHPCRELEKEGFDVTYLDVDEYGFIDPKDVKNALREDTVLVSIIYANNEIGTVEPIAEIGREILKWRKQHNSIYPYFHTDACQAAGALDLHVERLHVDLMTINGSKIYGPKGVGILYKRRGVDLAPIIYGGGQEMGVRSGTENVPAIVGMAQAVALAEMEKEKRNEKIEKLREYFWNMIQKKIDGVVLNGPYIYLTNNYNTKKQNIDRTVQNTEGILDERPPLAPPDRGRINRLPNNLNVTFEKVEAEALLLYLDSYGITVGTGSACATGSDEGSHVLKAIWKKKDAIEGSIRFSLGKDTTKEDIEYVMEYLPEIVERLRKLT